MDELGDINEPALQNNKKGKGKKIFLREPGRPTHYACVASGGPDNEDTRGSGWIGA